VYLCLHINSNLGGRGAPIVPAGRSTCLNAPDGSAVDSTVAKPLCSAYLVLAILICCLYL
jgi:hypothetical protein